MQEQHDRLRRRGRARLAAASWSTSRGQHTRSGPLHRIAASIVHSHEQKRAVAPYRRRQYDFSESNACAQRTGRGPTGPKGSPRFTQEVMLLHLPQQPQDWVLCVSVTKGAARAQALAALAAGGDCHSPERSTLTEHAGIHGRHGAAGCSSERAMICYLRCSCANAMQRVCRSIPGVWGSRGG